VPDIEAESSMIASTFVTGAQAAPGRRAEVPVGTSALVATTDAATATPTPGKSLFRALFGRTILLLGR
jgi:hypothetical protein